MYFSEEKTASVAQRLKKRQTLRKTIEIFPKADCLWRDLDANHASDLPLDKLPSLYNTPRAVSLFGRESLENVIFSGRG